MSIAKYFIGQASPTGGTILQKAAIIFMKNRLKNKILLNTTLCKISQVICESSSFRTNH